MQRLVAMVDPFVLTEHHLSTKVYLSIVAVPVHPVMTTAYWSLMAASSKIMCHVTNFNSSKAGFLN